MLDAASPNLCTDSAIDNVIVELVIALKQPPLAEPTIEVSKKLLVDGSIEKCDCLIGIQSARDLPKLCECVDNDKMLLTGNYQENGIWGKDTVSWPDFTNEPWYSNLPFYYQMVFGLMNPYEIVAMQLHQSLQAISVQPVCLYNNVWYKFGESISVDKCLECICSEEWTGPESCIKVTCMYDLYENIYNNMEGFELLSVEGECCQEIKITMADLCIGQEVICKPGVCLTEDNDWLCDCSNTSYIQTVDKKACIPNNPCIMMLGLCEPGGVCLFDGVDDYECLCNPGYTITEELHNCTDIDECTEEPGICGNGGLCTNNDGDYSCTCDEGFKLITKPEVICTNIDECAENSALCEHGKCVDTDGSYYCECNDGYSNPTGNNQECEDILECSLSPGICVNGDCLELDGSYTCLCDDGFVMAGGICVDIDECRSQAGICGLQECVNIPGGYQCFGGDIHIPEVITCPSGFTVSPDEEHCVDIDECVNMINSCGSGSCINTNGSFSCNCLDGYYYDADTLACEDINECEELPDLCIPGNCVNTVGFYDCTCPLGYNLVLSEQPHCEDVDECAITDMCGSPLGNTCGTHGTCVNIIGSYTCQCDEGYELLLPYNSYCVGVNLSNTPVM